MDNNLEAIWKIASLWLFRLNDTKVICVTGSAGKTTTTRTLTSVIRQRFSFFETMENWNDECLVPIMISLIEPDCEYAILKLGMGLCSSVSKMANAIRPDALVLTNIGYAHIQRTGSLEGTRDEKCGAERGLVEAGRVFINGDDPLLREYNYLHSVTTYGTGLHNDVHPQAYLTFLPKHLMYSAIAAFAVGSYVGLSKDEIIDGIKAFRDFIQCDHFLLIDSSFNANPASMKIAIDTLYGYDGERIAVLGDMLELGSYSKQLHHELGAYVAASNIDTLIAIGKYAEDIKAGVNNKAVSVIVSQIKAGDIKNGFGNPRKIGKRRLEELEKSFEMFGDFSIYLIDEHNNIIAGNQRLKVVLTNYGSDTILDCKRLIGYTQEELRAINIKDNIHAGDWDLDLLADWTANLNVDFGISSKDVPIDERKIKALELIRYEKYDYVLLVCRNEVDYNNLLRLFGLEDSKVLIAKHRKIKARAVWYDTVSSQIIPKKDA